MPKEGSKAIQAAKASAKAAGGGSGSGKSKKKWSKAKAKENKTVNAVLFDAATHEKLMKTIPSSKLITISTISERLGVNGTCARRALKLLASKGLIKPVCLHSAQVIYTRATKSKDEGEAPAAGSAPTPAEKEEAPAADQ